MSLSVVFLISSFFPIKVLSQCGDTDVTFCDLDNTLRNELEDAFDDNHRLIGSVVRLIFHDCSGQQENNLSGIGGTICDGCIDLSNTAHAGIQSLAINPLEQIYTSNNNNWNNRMSRADFWAAIATIAIQYAQDLDNSNDILPNIPFYIGRQDCSASPNIELRNYRLPYKSFPNDKGGWNESLLWFQTNFNFNTQQTVAIIGAHTIGRLHSQFSGYGTGNFIISTLTRNSLFRFVFN